MARIRIAARLTPFVSHTLVRFEHENAVTANAPVGFAVRCSGAPQPPPPALRFHRLRPTAARRAWPANPPVLRPMARQNDDGLEPLSPRDAVELYNFDEDEDDLVGEFADK